MPKIMDSNQMGKMVLFLYGNEAIINHKNKKNKWSRQNLKNFYNFFIKKYH